MDNNNGLTKICTDCGLELPATIEFFYRKKKTGTELRSRCKVCTNKENAGWKEAHRTEWDDYHQQYEKRRWSENKEEESARYRDWRLSNLDYARKRVRDYYYANKDKERIRHRRWASQSMARKAYMRDYLKIYRKERKDYLRELHRRWSVMNPESIKANHQRRRARLRNANGSFTAADIQLMYKQQKAKCWYCQKSIEDGYHIEHRVPLSRGGSNNPSNIVLACPSCNLSKHDKLPHEWGDRLL